MLIFFRKRVIDIGGRVKQQRAIPFCIDQISIIMMSFVSLSASKTGKFLRLNVKSLQEHNHTFPETYHSNHVGRLNIQAMHSMCHLRSHRAHTYLVAMSATFGAR
jgi:hypothetical protein